MKILKRHSNSSYEIHFILLFYFRINAAVSVQPYCWYLVSRNGGDIYIIRLDYDRDFKIIAGKDGKPLIQQLHRRNDLIRTLGMQLHIDAQICQLIIHEMTFADHVDILSQKILKACLVAVEIGCVCPVQLGCRACRKQCPFLIDALNSALVLDSK